jgi:hypothetical protein
MKKLSITLIEVNNFECPNIGTIIGATEEELLCKFTAAIESHFDGQLTGFDVSDGLGLMDLKNSPPIDAFVTIDNENSFSIELQQTFIY